MFKSRAVFADLRKERDVSDSQWYENETEDEEAFDEVMKNNKKRFWLRRGESRNIAFMADSPVLILEHDFRIDGHFGNQFTCLRYLKVKCPGCSTSFEAKKVAVYPILDLTPFTVGQGTDDEKEIKFFRRLLVAPVNILKIIKDKQAEIKEQHDMGLSGAAFKVTRGESPRAARVGDLYQYMRHTDLKKYTWTDRDGAEFVLDPLSVDLFKPNPQAMAVAVAKATGKTPAPRPAVEDDEEPAYNEVDVTDDEIPF